jgi:hypothetical protein
VGKLARRLADPSRSGVYRIRSTEAVQEAAALNGQRVVVLVLDGDDEALLQVLKAQAEKAKKRGGCLFAALLDPEGKAALAPLYSEKS